MSRTMMRILHLMMASLLVAAPAVAPSQPAGVPAHGAPGFETRCGWFDNPTPANVSLYDRDGEWIIGQQGGHQVEGDWPWPDFPPQDFVVTNSGMHGFGCACLLLQVDVRTRNVLQIRNSRPRPLNACRQDLQLRRWRQLFTGRR